MDYPVLGHYDPTVEATDHGSGEEEQELLCKCSFCIVVYSRARSFHLLVTNKRRQETSFLVGEREKENCYRNFSGLVFYSTRDFLRIVCFSPPRHSFAFERSYAKYRIAAIHISWYQLFLRYARNSQTNNSFYQDYITRQNRRSNFISFLL